MAKAAPILKADGFYIGEDKTLRFAVTDGAGAPQPLTGWALEWILRARPGGAVLVTKTTGAGGITLPDAPGGIAEVQVPAADTVNRQPGTYHHTLRRTGSGVAQVLATGAVVLQLADTR